MSQVGAPARLGPVQLGIIALAVITAVVHISLAIPKGLELVMFYFNGLGYLALTAALFLPQFAGWRRQIRWALLAYAAVTILAWVAIGERTPIGYLDKLVELALIGLLWLDGRQPR